MNSSVYWVLNHLFIIPCSQCLIQSNFILINPAYTILYGQGMNAVLKFKWNLNSEWTILLLHYHLQFPRVLYTSEYILFMSWGAHWTYQFSPQNRLNKFSCLNHFGLLHKPSQAILLETINPMQRVIIEFNALWQQVLILHNLYDYNYWALLKL